MAAGSFSEGSVRLRDGRRLGFLECGSASGPPVLVFHGNPGCRLDLKLLERSCLPQAGIHFIAPDRPGIGLSDAQAGRRLLDWPDDVAELADQLGIGRFTIIGLSAGGPYAAACAYRIPGRLRLVVLVSSTTPPEARRGADAKGSAYFRLARLSPWAVWPMLAGMRNAARDPRQLLQRAFASLPAPGRDTLAKPNVAAAYAATMREALRRPVGLAIDAHLVARSWGFPLDDIALPVFIWHGLLDRNTPWEFTYYLALTIPDNRAELFPQDGQLSLPVQHFDDVLALLVNETRL